MHDPHPTNGPPRPQSPPVDVVAAQRVTLADGRSCVVARYTPAETAGLTVAVGSLLAACGDPPPDVVVLAPREADDASSLLGAALACDAETPVLATAGPVTDAVKRIAADRVVATLDRSDLAWAIGPAVVHGPSLLGLLRRTDLETVRPLRDLGADIAWL